MRIGDKYYKCYGSQAHGRAVRENCRLLASGMGQSLTEAVYWGMLDPKDINYLLPLYLEARRPFR